LYVVRGLFTRGLREATARYLARSVYGLVCFATLFSFLGTVLGGIWADQSWGRFWGWDPKENGALIIVLWNALILHAWRGGLVRERGLMNLALFGNVTISFAWFGVNMLGVGLHSYAFMDRAFDWLAGFVLSQLLLIANGLLHRRYWRSFGLPSSPLLWAVRGTAVLLSAGALVTGMSGRWLGALVWLVCLLFFVAVANLVAANWLAGEPPEAPAPVSPAQ
jgi:cytochrome c biogenesis factor